MEKSEKNIKKTKKPTKQNDNGLCLRRDKPQKEHVAPSAIETLERGLPKRRVLVQGNTLVLRADQVVYNVRASGLPAAVTEPLFAVAALRHALFGVHPTITIMLNILV